MPPISAVVASGTKEYKCRWVLEGIWDLPVAADPFLTVWFLLKIFIYTNVKEAICCVCCSKYRDPSQNSGLNRTSMLEPPVFFKVWHAIHCVKIRTKKLSSFQYPKKKTKKKKPKKKATHNKHSCYILSQHSALFYFLIFIFGMLVKWLEVN